MEQVPKIIEFACCYCDKVMAPLEIHTVVLVWPDEDASEQTWWCHRSCFEASLNPGYRMMRDAQEDPSETANGC